MSTYNIDLVDGIVKVGFGEPAQNDQIVKDAKAQADAISHDPKYQIGDLVD